MVNGTFIPSQGERDTGSAAPWVPFVLSEADRRRREADVEERRPRCKREQVVPHFDVRVGRCAPSASLGANG